MVKILNKKMKMNKKNKKNQLNRNNNSSSNNNYYKMVKTMMKLIHKLVKIIIQYN